MSIVTRAKLNKALREEAKYRLHYVDYDADTYTAPLLLTPERIEQILSDDSIDEVVLFYPWRPRK